jgi:hypothetical protein
LEAAQVLAHAFVTNPLHVAAFGAGALTRNEAFFRIGLSVMRGGKFVAVSNARILGVPNFFMCRPAKVTPAPRPL